jgi:cobalt-zinc-cadmium efflux system membrane fusion protein
MSRAGSLALLMALACMVAIDSGAAAQDGLPSVLQVDPAAARQIAVVPVTTRDPSISIGATALVQPDASAIAHITTRTPARVVRLIVELGQNVAPGQPLAVLSSIELGKAKTEYLKARALSDIARQNLEREQQLYAEKISAMKDLLAARAAQAAARSQYEAARESLRVMIPPEQLRHLDWSANSPLADFPLVSPIAGTLVKRDLVLGAAVSPSDEPLTVINLDRVWVEANIFEHDIAQIRVSAPATVVVEAYPRKRFTGKVSYVGDLVDTATHTVPARIVVANPDHLLKPGMFAKVEIQGHPEAAPAPAVPVAATYRLDGQALAFVALGGARFAPRPLRLGSEDHGYVTVLRGLTPGEQVAAGGGLILKSLLANHE